MTIKIIGGEFEKSVFPGGEVHVRVIKAPRYADNYVEVQADLKSSEDIMTLLLLADALGAMGAPITKLYIPYIPYARQDRICNTGEAFSIKVMAGLINSINADEVWFADPHSDVTPALIDNGIIMGVDHIFKFRDDLLKDKMLVCPDAGAEKRVSKLKRPYIMATKVRDPLTTKILETKVYADDLTGQTCLIVDDICDGGRTFIELAKVLRAKGAKSVELYVTHGIFSQGFHPFHGLIDKIYTYDGIRINTLDVQSL